jgi:GNAT superfamily N-acetyltransferase
METLAPELRGLGLGRRLLGEMERLALEAGSTVIRLDTNRVLTEAVSLYTISGYVEIDAFNKKKAPRQGGVEHKESTSICLGG